MASDDSSLSDEVRLLTHYDSSIISEADLTGLIGVAKEEIKAEVDDGTLTFYSGNIQADRALFWLVCIFSKIHMGEIDAPNFEVSELKVRSSSFSEQNGLWFDNFSQRLEAISPGARIGHVKVSRADRSYQFDN
jgi:hypothetical protein